MQVIVITTAALTLSGRVRGNGKVQQQRHVGHRVAEAELQDEVHASHETECDQAWIRQALLLPSKQQLLYRACLSELPGIDTAEVIGVGVHK